jgi:Flp pilus assembly protein TadB
MTMERPEPAAAMPTPGNLRQELPWLVLQAAFLVVLLHANSPEVWFWFAALLVLLTWRTMSWQNRRWERLQARAQEPPSTSGSSTGSPG